MSTKKRWLTLVFALIVLYGLPWSSAIAQTGEGGRFFPETGHWVSGPFLAKYESVPNGEELFGQPISGVFTVQPGGFEVQYFEKARFEIHPENTPELQVQLSLLGQFLYTPGNPVAIPDNLPACRSFPEADHAVCYAFEEFFETNGGIGQFGYPISGFEIHDGWISQYFQRALFEWHPENPPGERVVLANLGSRFFNFNNEDPLHLKAKLTDNIPQQIVSDLQIYAFVGKPILPVDENLQEIYVIVYDQNFNPVHGAIVSYLIELPSGNSLSDSIGSTNLQGISSATMIFPEKSRGTIEIVITVTLKTAIQEQTLTSFQVW